MASKKRTASTSLQSQSHVGAEGGDDQVDCETMTSPKSQMACRNSGNFSDDSILDLNSPNSPSHSSSLSGSSNSLANTPAPTFNHDDISAIGPASSSARGRSNLRG
ncbi:hypothetical protein OUZ56_005499 [Daphnia magna]|uniref:Uncharacterized protein n=1 Tax=Daphnia magna TaxID=35525 RepID=A0ABQ9YT23_9CRUS|nr:hypothetical protein OUZ56_005499 [Daphnia magna]